MAVVIYGLVDPTDEQIHYVGRTTNPARRLVDHLAAKEWTGRRRVTWLRSLRAHGLEPRMQILETVVDGDGVLEEQKWLFWGETEGWPLSNAAGAIIKDGYPFSEYQTLVRKGLVPAFFRQLSLASRVAFVHRLHRAFSERQHAMTAEQGMFGLPTDQERQSAWTDAYAATVAEFARGEG